MRQVNYKTKVCVRCNTPFQAMSGRSRYCSYKCRIGQSKCVLCGVVFDRSSNSAGKYCSRDCYTKRETGSSLQARTSVCVNCRIEFTVTGRSRRKTCSDGCADAIRRKPRGSCKECGKELDQTVPPRQRHCSRRCANLHKRPIVHGVPVGSTSGAGCGYRQIKTKSGWMAEHRHVMSQILGRPLESHERVHHRNGRRADNRPENLELWKVTKKDPAGVRAADYHCAGCHCYQVGRTAIVANPPSDLSTGVSA